MLHLAMPDRSVSPLLALLMKNDTSFGHSSKLLCFFNSSLRRLGDCQAQPEYFDKPSKHSLEEPVARAHVGLGQCRSLSWQGAISQPQLGPSDKKRSSPAKPNCRRGANITYYLCMLRRPETRRRWRRDGPSRRQRSSGSRSPSWLPRKTHR